GLIGTFERIRAGGKVLGASLVSDLYRSRCDVAAEEGAASAKGGHRGGSAADERVTDDEARLDAAREHGVEESHGLLRRIRGAMDALDRPDVREIAPTELAAALAGEDHRLVAAPE